jgi:hypothetical protein
MAAVLLCYSGLTSSSHRLIISLSQTLLPAAATSENAGDWRVGSKAAYELFPAGLKSRLQVGGRDLHGSQVPALLKPGGQC